MSEDRDIPMVQPVGVPPEPRPRRYYDSPRPSLLGSLGQWFLRALLIGSIMLNLFFIFFVIIPSLGSDRPPESFHSGDRSSNAKVAIVRIEGPLMEGLLDYPTRQLKAAAHDKDVKAVVVLINSPGGSVTASDMLHKQIKDLRDGKWENQAGGPKKVVVAMEGVAASGGYYIAVPGEIIYAQPTTITGSIGVYAAFLDLTGIKEKLGVGMNILKEGELKASGSMFAQMNEEERRYWQALLGETYDRFINIVKEGRGNRLQHDLGAEIHLKDREGKPITRRLADGGVFTAQQAKQFGLVDEIGYLDDAVKKVKELAGLGQARVITYDKPVSLFGGLLGAKSKPPEGQINLDHLPGATARIWYLTPGYELSGLKLPVNLLK